MRAGRARENGVSVENKTGLPAIETADPDKTSLTFFRLVSSRTQMPPDLPMRLSFSVSLVPQVLDAETANPRTRQRTFLLKIHSSQNPSFRKRLPRNKMESKAPSVFSVHATR